ncbi:MAG: hypothetical protein ACKPKO_02745, partial [Candidatus Fonsibacter sp.]
EADALKSLGLVSKDDRRAPRNRALPQLPTYYPERRSQRPEHALPKGGIPRSNCAAACVTEVLEDLLHVTAHVTSSLGSLFLGEQFLDGVTNDVDQHHAKKGA